jgi:hypothetical protein
MRKLVRTFPFTLVLLVLLVALGAGAAFAAHSAQSARTASPPCPTNAPPVVGVTIPPHAVGVAAIAVTRPGQVPAFTERDVRAYVAANGFPGGSTAAGGMPPIRCVSFIPREQAESLMRGESLGALPAGTIVCYVEFAGPIVGYPYSMPMVPDPNDHTTPAPYHMASGHEVFDARNGSLLNWGVLPN